MVARLSTHRLPTNTTASPLGAGSFLRAKVGDRSTLTAFYCYRWLSWLDCGDAHLSSTLPQSCVIAPDVRVAKLLIVVHIQMSPQTRRIWRGTHARPLAGHNGARVQQRKQGGALRQ